MKICSKCKTEKPYTEFHFNKRSSDGYENRCKPCRKVLARKAYVENPFKFYVRLKRSESLKLGIDFDLDETYLKDLWTGVCPITGAELSIANEGKGSHKSGHLDRKDPDKGYVKGNVQFISGRINRIKYNATLEELKLLVAWMESQESATTIPSGSTPQANGGGSGERLIFPEWGL